MSDYVQGKIMRWADTVPGKNNQKQEGVYRGVQGEVELQRGNCSVFENSTNT